VLSGAGVGAGMFDPQSVSAGTYYPNYTYTDLNGCTSADSVLIFVDVCTGIASATINDAVTLYPNPASNDVWMDLSAIKQKTVVVTLYDIAGKQLMAQELATGAIVKINVSEIDKGIYIVRVQSAEGIVLQKQLIVTH